MRTFALAGLVATAAALPQYSSWPESSRSGNCHPRHLHHSGGTESGKLANPTGAASSLNASFPSITAGIDHPYGTGYTSTHTDVVTSTQYIKSTVYYSGGTAQATDIADSTDAAVTTPAAATKAVSLSKSKSKGSHHKSSSAESTPSSTSTPMVSNTTTSSNSNGSSTTNGSFLRGINIGNWLILEKWMDSTPFTGAFASAPDQWNFDSAPGAQAALNTHWSTWFTESDVQQISSYGFNALRIPIGFWAFDNSGTPYQTGAAFWLDQAISWARKYNMKVLVDCHGSPGSQNGKMHSGHAGAIEWQSGDNLNKSTEILVTMTKKYGAANYSDVVWGIEMVNEPQAGSPNSFSTSQSWAQETYKQMYGAAENKQLRIITHDSFMGPTAFAPIAKSLVAAAPAHDTFGVDQHNYQLYTDADNALDQPAHIREACGWAGPLASAKSSMPTIVGEWSALTNICAKSDGETVSQAAGCAGADGCSCTSSDPAQWGSALVDAVRKYAEAQLEVFEQNSDGYFLWSWKGPGGWGVEGPSKVGAFPKNVVTDRKYSNLCGGN